VSCLVREVEDAAGERHERMARGTGFTVQLENPEGGETEEGSDREQA
jgi:hypothetical protein